MSKIQGLDELLNDLDNLSQDFNNQRTNKKSPKTDNDLSLEKSRSRASLLIDELDQLSEHRLSFTSEDTPATPLSNRRSRPLSKISPHLPIILAAPNHEKSLVEEKNRLQKELNDLKSIVSEHEAELHSLKTNTTELESENQLLNETIGELEGSLESMTLRVKDLEEELSNVESQMKSVEAEKEKVELKWKTLSKENADLESKILHLTNQINEAGETTDSLLKLEIEREQLHAKVQDLSNELTKVQNQAELLENQLQTMTSDRNELAIQSENHFKELQSMEIKLKELTEKDQSDELKREMECLSDEKKQLTIQLKSASELISQLETREAKVVDEISYLKTNVQGMEMEYEAKLLQMSNMEEKQKEQIERLNLEVIAFQNQDILLSEELSRLKMSNVELEQKLHNQQDSLNEDYSKLVLELSNLKIQLANVTTENEELIERSRKSDEQVSELVEKLQDRDSTNSSIIDKLEEEKKLLETEIAALKDVTLESRDQLNELSKENDALKAQLSGSDHDHVADSELMKTIETLKQENEELKVTQQILLEQQLEHVHERDAMERELNNAKRQARGNDKDSTQSEQLEDALKRIKLLESIISDHSSKEETVSHKRSKSLDTTERIRDQVPQKQDQDWEKVMAEYQERTLIAMNERDEIIHKLRSQMDAIKSNVKLIKAEYSQMLEEKEEKLRTITAQHQQFVQEIYDESSARISKAHRFLNKNHEAVQTTPPIMDTKPSTRSNNWFLP